MSAVNRITSAVLSAASDAGGDDATELDVVGGVVIAAATVVGLAGSAMVELARRTAHLPTTGGALSRAVVALADLESRRVEEDEVPS